MPAGSLIHSWAPGGGRGSAGCVQPRGGPAAGSPSLGVCLPAPTPFRGLRTLALYTFVAKQPANLGEDPRLVRPGAESGRPGAEALVPEGSGRGPARPPSVASPAHRAPATAPDSRSPTAGLLHTPPQGPPRYRSAPRWTPWGHAPQCRAVKSDTNTVDIGIDPLPLFAPQENYSAFTCGEPALRARRPGQLPGVRARGPGRGAGLPGRPGPAGRRFLVCGSRAVITQGRTETGQALIPVSS